MKEYNLTGVKCGINSTHYWNAQKAGIYEYETISYSNCKEDWICIDWSDCENGKQTRKCVDKNDCGTFYKRPEESKECVVSLQQIIEAPFKSTTTTSKVETYPSTKQLLLENYPIILNVLLVLLVSMPASLIFLGIKKDYKKIRKKYKK